jgi:Fic family protein/DNA-binding XRE family transcriptional regulator
MNKKVTDTLKEILTDSQWTQEQLAHYLGVTFSTLNGWVNGKAIPRAKALQAIDDAYLSIIGRVNVDKDMLKKMKKQAMSQRTNVKKIIANEQLLEKVTLYLTYHTNTIEGSTMTLSEVQEVLEDDNKVLTNKTAREQVEARNHRTALYFLLDELAAQGKNLVWTRDLILNTHLRLMNTLISDAGNFRNHDVRIQGSPVKLISHKEVLAYMDELFEDLNRPYSDTIDTIAALHARFERIHPFSDGNGRTGRLIMFIQALQNELVPPLVLKERKHAYYKYLETADLDDKTELLSLFIAESMLAAGSIVFQER